jgi:septal ring factor EnvC (AmiA/AmiB activator)
MLLENPNARGVYAEALLEESVRMSLESLKVLEGKVEDTVARYATLAAERDGLQEQLKQAQVRIAEIAGQLAVYEKERAQVRARVESILGRLEGLDLS